VEAQADILVTKEALPDLELIGTFRSLVERVIVSPRKAGEEYEVSIRGYLASLMGPKCRLYRWLRETATSQNYGTVILLPETRSVVL
jgi:hypothetical protein